MGTPRLPGSPCGRVVTLSPVQALRAGPLPAVPAAGAAGQRVRARDEGPAPAAAVGRVQGEVAVRPAGPPASAPVHLPAPRGVRCPVPGGTHHQHLPRHPGESATSPARGGGRGRGSGGPSRPSPPPRCAGGAGGLIPLLFLSPLDLAAG